MFIAEHGFLPAGQSMFPSGLAPHINTTANWILTQPVIINVLALISAAKLIIDPCTPHVGDQV